MNDDGLTAIIKRENTAIKSRDRTQTLRNTHTLIFVDGCALFVASLVGFFHRAVQPAFYQLEDATIGDPPCYTKHQLMMREGIKVRRKIRVDDFRITLAQSVPDRSQGVMSAGPRAVSILLFGEVCLENGFEDQNHRHHAHPIPKGREP